jgi:hypothetical protein
VLPTEISQLTLLEVFEVGGNPLVSPPLEVAEQGIEGIREYLASPGVPDALVVGGRAIVNTSEGDTLSLRDGPGLGFVVITRLVAGTPVTLLEGPHAYDGYNWWRIRTPDGLEGWSVESVDDRGTRLQTLLPAP